MKVAALELALMDRFKPQASLNVNREKKKASAKRKGEREEKGRARKEKGEREFGKR